MEPSPAVFSAGRTVDVQCGNGGHVETLSLPKNNGATRVLIVDDQKLIREGLSLQMNTELELRVVGEAADADEGLSKAIEQKPDIVLMDIDMPGMSCFEAVRRIQELLPRTRVIILSGYRNDRHIRDAIEARAWGYALKDHGFQEVKTAIRDVIQGKLYYAPEILERVETEHGRLTWASSPKTKFEKLTRRERELFHLLVQCKSLKDVATGMNCEYKTADKHKANLMKKLGVHDRMELLHIAVREGILPK